MTSVKCEDCNYCLKIVIWIGKSMKNVERKYQCVKLSNACKNLWKMYEVCKNSMKCVNMCKFCVILACRMFKTV